MIDVQVDDNITVAITPTSLQELQTPSFKYEIPIPSTTTDSSNTPSDDTKTDEPFGKSSNSSETIQTAATAPTVVPDTEIIAPTTGILAVDDESKIVLAVTETAPPTVACEPSIQTVVEDPNQPIQISIDLVKLAEALDSEEECNNDHNEIVEFTVVKESEMESVDDTDFFTECNRLASISLLENDLDFNDSFDSECKRQASILLIDEDTEFTLDNHVNTESFIMECKRQASILLIDEGDDISNFDRPTKSNDSGSSFVDECQRQASIDYSFELGEELDVEPKSSNSTLPTDNLDVQEPVSNHATPYVYYDEVVELGECFPHISLSLILC